MGWAKEAGKDIHSKEQERHSAKDWTLFVRDQINLNADGLWTALVTQVLSDSEEFECHSPRKSLRAERFGNSLRVQRFLIPLQILEFIYTPHRKLTVLWNGDEVAVYRFAVDEHGQVSFADETGVQLTVEQVSFQSFRPLVELYRQGFPSILSA